MVVLQEPPLEEVHVPLSSEGQGSSASGTQEEHAGPSQVDLGHGIQVPQAKLEYVMRKGRRDSMVCKDVVRMLWKPTELIGRSVTGKPWRHVATNEAMAKMALTPQKMDAVKSK